MPKYKDEPMGLYLHIPFCKSKCYYCDFCSFPSRDSSLVDAYVAELCRHMCLWEKRCYGRSFDTVYIGGGTPTLLNGNQAKKIIEGIKKHFDIAPNAEITVECNPATATESSFSLWRELGINRLSIGVQSASNQELCALGRPHDFDAAVQTVWAAREAGISNINVDLMIGIPYQTIDSLAETLDRYIDLNCQHISAYCLSIEEGTRFFKMRDILPIPYDDDVADMYRFVSQRLCRAGYEHYEISNFARSGFRSKHNMHTWQYREYLGLGIAAHSFFEGERFGNGRDLDAFLRGEDITFERYQPDNVEQMSEYVMLGLRLREGIDEDAFLSRFDIDFMEKYGERCRPYIDSGHIERKDGRIYMKEDSWLVSNSILADIL